MSEFTAEEIEAVYKDIFRSVGLDGAAADVGAVDPARKAEIIAEIGRQQEARAARALANAKFSKEEHEASLAKCREGGRGKDPVRVLAENSDWKLAVRLDIWESSVDDGIGLNTTEDPLIIGKYPPFPEIRVKSLFRPVFFEILQAVLKEYPSGIETPWGVASWKYPGSEDDGDADEIPDIERSLN